MTDGNTVFVAVADRNALADSWASIAEASRPQDSKDGAADAAEWAIKQSLSALKIAKERAASLVSSLGSSESS